MKQEIIDKIKRELDQTAFESELIPDFKKGFSIGATLLAERVEKLADALDKILRAGKFLEVDNIADAALTEYKNYLK